jgi:DNA-binding transcriptional MerR regulator
VFTIGEFSKITGLTVKALRFYHEQGLLIPTNADDETGYRDYDRSKIETARSITHLRTLDLSLDEIGTILRCAGDDADLRDVMERQKSFSRTPRSWSTSAARAITFRFRRVRFTTKDRG